MNVSWLIDGDMFPHYRDELVAAIHSQGHVAKLVYAPSPPYVWDDKEINYRHAFDPDQCVVAHGDIELVSRIYNEKHWRPGVFATVENYFVTSYLEQFGDFCLNRDCTTIPFAELKDRKDWLFDVFGVEGQIFVRPDSPLKLFTGQTTSSESFDTDIEFMGFYEFPLDSIVIVSSPKRVIREWRFVVCQGSVAAGCLYAEEGRFRTSTAVDHSARNLAQEIAATSHPPDPVWIVDICETSDGKFHLLEIGGFSFADLYACNKSDIVREVSAAALAVWESGDDDAT